MGNNWCEQYPNLSKHEFEVYHNQRSYIRMTTFHEHSFYEVRIVLSSKATHVTETKIASLHRGYVTIIPPGVFHRTFNEKDAEPYTRLLVYISPTLMQTLSFDSVSVKDLFNHFGNTVQHLLLDESTLSTLVDPLVRIVEADDDDKPLRHLHNRMTISSALILLAEQIQQRKMESTNESALSLIPSVISYINNHLSSDLSLDHLADLFFINKYYLAHQFREYTKISVHQYVIARRMTNARDMLRSGEKATDTAQACGYREYSTFYKAFLREFGISPSVYAEDPSKYELVEVNLVED